MGQVKKISVEQLREHSTPCDCKTVLWHGISFTLKPLLSFGEVTKFVDSVLNACSGKHDGEHDGLFIPEMKDFAIRANTVLRYACVDLPSDFGEQYELLYTTDIYDCILSAINRPQFDSILDAINTCINR